MLRITETESLHFKSLNRHVREHMEVTVARCKFAERSEWTGLDAKLMQERIADIRSCIDEVESVLRDMLPELGLK